MNVDARISADRDPPERDADAIARLPGVYSLALRLKAAGVDDALIGECLGLDPVAVGPLLVVARAKLAEALGDDQATRLPRGS